MFTTAPCRQPAGSRTTLTSPPSLLLRAPTLTGSSSATHPALTCPPVHSYSSSSSGPHGSGSRNNPTPKSTEEPRRAPGTQPALRHPKLHSSVTSRLPPSAEPEPRNTDPSGQPGRHTSPVSFSFTWKLLPRAVPAHNLGDRPSLDQVALLGSWPFLACPIWKHNQNRSRQETNQY